MDLIQIVGIILVIFGSLFMAASILTGFKTKKDIPPALARKWLTLSILMVAFLIGYLGLIFIQIYNIQFPFKLFVSIIFFAGGFFVFLIINLSRTTIFNLSDNASNLAKINKNLDILVHKRTSELEVRQKELHERNLQIEKAYNDLKNAQSQLLQQEKMASIGQLAAGIAHEINNPMGFISSNLKTLEKYMDILFEFIKTLTEVLKSLNAESQVQENRKKTKIDFIIKDTKDLVIESLNGAERVSEIVQNLRTFSRVDEASNIEADINECLESTVKIIWNELKYKAKVIKEYGELPLVKCYPQELSQVFMNLMINAVHAIKDQGEITIKTWQDGGDLVIAISDTGEGIPVENLNRLFEPFFTTKDIGKGTGLGLSISYEIIQKHNGDISVESEIGKGTTFTIKLPIA